MRRVPLWVAFLAAGAVLTGAYLWAPGLKGSAPLFNFLGLAPVLAIVAGVLIYRPASRGPWWWFAAGMGLFWLGDLSPGGAAYVAVSPVLMVGLLLLVPRRNPESDRAGVIDYVLFGAAALHPSMRRLQGPVAGHQSRLTATRLALLTAASLVAPAIEMLSRETTDLQVVIGASAVLFGFVVARMAGLVLAQQRSAERERTLAAAGAALVAATTREQIGMAGEDAARRLAGANASVLVVVSGDEWPALRDAAGEAIVTLDEATCLALRLPFGRRRALVHELSDGFLVVAHPAVEDLGVRRALHALGVQIELAMKSAALTKEIHRRAGESRVSALVQHSNDLIAERRAAPRWRRPASTRCG